MFKKLKDDTSGRLGGKEELPGCPAGYICKRDEWCEAENKKAIANSRTEELCFSAKHFADLNNKTISLCPAGSYCPGIADGDKTLEADLIQ